MEAHLCSCSARDSSIEEIFSVTTCYCSCNKVYYAIMTAYAYTKVLKYHGRTKYVDTQYHYIRDVITQREVVVKHFSTT